MVVHGRNRLDCIQPDGIQSDGVNIVKYETFQCEKNLYLPQVKFCYIILA